MDQPHTQEQRKHASAIQKRLHLHVACAQVEGLGVNCRPIQDRRGAVSLAASQPGRVRAGARQHDGAVLPAQLQHRGLHAELQHRSAANSSCLQGISNTFGNSLEKFQVVEKTTLRALMNLWTSGFGPLAENVLSSPDPIHPQNKNLFPGAEVHTLFSHRRKTTVSVLT